MYRLNLALSLLALAICLPNVSAQIEINKPAFSATGLQRCEALMQMLDSQKQSVMHRFITEHLAASYVEGRSHEELVAFLTKARKRCGNPGGIEIRPIGEHKVRMCFDGSAGYWDLHVEVESRADQRIVDLVMKPGTKPEALPQLTWEGYEGTLDLAAEDGVFAGAVLVVRNGVTVLNRGFGFSDNDETVPNTEKTIFAIGSVPIDFTNAAILMLSERGKLNLNDKVSKYLGGVPADKAGMRIEHLRTGRSGLKNFHGIRGVDADMDLSYIDRKEAMRRILGSELMFKPGEGRAHSHSAWGVLAAVVEVASGQTFDEFLQTQIFEPAGMERTGMYPLAQNYGAKQVAMGLGLTALDKPSTPLNWDKTSWLVMGSGGMVSNPTDLYRFMKAMRGGEFLTAAGQKKFWSKSILEGGNDRGFYCVYNEGPDTLAIVCCNSHERHNDEPSRLGKALVKLAMDAVAPAPYFFGLAAKVQLGEKVEVKVVVPGGPAHAAGLRPGMIVSTIDGQPAEGNFQRLLVEAATEGKAIVLVVDSDGDKKALKIQPVLRK